MNETMAAPNGGGSSSVPVATTLLDDISSEELLAILESRKRMSQVQPTASLEQHQITSTQQPVAGATSNFYSDGGRHSSTQSKPGCESHPLYSKLSTGRAKKAFAKLWDQTKWYGCNDEVPKLPHFVTDPVTKQLGPPVHDPDFFHCKCPEEKYSKPDGFVALNRSFFPTDIGKDAKHRITAVRNCPQSASEDDIDDQIELQKQLHKEITTVISSKCKLLLFRKADELQIMHAGRKTRKFEEIRQEFHQNPSRVLLEQLYNMTYRPREDGHSFNEIMYAACQELKIYCPAADTEKDFTNKGSATVPKAHVMSKTLHNKFREICRNSIYGKPAHGITITISNKERNGRRKKGFSFSYNVKGWDEELHRKWKQDMDTVKIGGIVEATKVTLFEICAHPVVMHLL